MINPTTHAITEFPIPTATCRTARDHGGPRRQPLVHRGSAPAKIGMINPTTHAITEFAIPTADSSPTGSRRAPTATSGSPSHGGNKIGMINPTTHAITEFAIPTADSAPVGITAGPDGNLWFTEPTAARIGTINPTTHAHHRVPHPHRRLPSPAGSRRAPTATSGSPRAWRENRRRHAGASYLVGARPAAGHRRAGQRPSA